MHKCPNILFIMTDQQSYNMLSCTGGMSLFTPALDRLSEEGARFEHAVCANPVCLPSRVSMATGMMPGRLGIYSNKGGRDAEVPRATVENSMGNIMKRAGYDTFYGGKVHLCPQLRPWNAGYDEIHGNSRETLADGCIQFIGKKRSNPFFALASFINPHDICFAHNAREGRTPHIERVTDLYKQASKLPDEALPPLPENFKLPDHEPEGLEMRNNYRAVTPSGTMFRTYNERDWRIYRWIYARLTEEVDQQIGRILQAMKRKGLESDTLVLFTSDHGNMQGNHGLASKAVFYEESVRVPMLMKFKGSIAPGQVNTGRLVNTGLDILPTCCDYADIDVPESVCGLSLRPAAGGDVDGPEHEFVVSENKNGRMLRDRRWKYSLYKGEKPAEVLTDLEKDPGEMKNLAIDPAHEARLENYRKLFERWCEESGDMDGLKLLKTQTS